MFLVTGLRLLSCAKSLCLWHSDEDIKLHIRTQQTPAGLYQRYDRVSATDSSDTVIDVFASDSITDSFPQQ